MAYVAKNMEENLFHLKNFQVYLGWFIILNSL